MCIKIALKQIVTNSSAIRFPAKLNNEKVASSGEILSFTPISKLNIDRQLLSDSRRPLHWDVAADLWNMKLRFEASETKNGRLLKLNDELKTMLAEEKARTRKLARDLRDARIQLATYRKTASTRMSKCETELEDLRKEYLEYKATVEREKAQTVNPQTADRALKATKRQLSDRETELADTRSELNTLKMECVRLRSKMVDGKQGQSKVAKLEAEKAELIKDAILSDRIISELNDSNARLKEKEKQLHIQLLELHESRNELANSKAMVDRLRSQISNGLLSSSEQRTESIHQLETLVIQLEKENADLKKAMLDADQVDKHDLKNRVHQLETQLAHEREDKETLALEFNGTHLAALTSCAHVLCCKCIERQDRVRPNCPMCQTDFRQSNISKLFL
ncbi:hypothetical protein HDE_06481 [Halotydeus destructor]|nr:hypothetical protein HDE_06481 [Halotydeus destructor]